MQVLAAADDLVVCVGRDGTCLDAAGMAGLLGDIAGQPLRDALPCAVAEAAVECLERAFATGEQQLRECRLPLHGEPRDFEMRFVPTSSEEALVILRETTKWKRVVEEAQRMAAVGRLASGVAHDFNNLLTVMSAYGHMLLEEPAGSPDARDQVEEILRTVERASALTCQLLAFSRRQIGQPRAVDLNELVLNLDHMLRRVISEDIEMVTALSPDAGMISGDPAQLEQVIINLVVNSRDAMPEGGRITIETASRSHPARPGEFVALSVTDTGVGMDEETKARIFEPFFTTKDQGRGTGLGLATVHSIVKNGGGEISVTSAPGRGTSVAIHFPRACALVPEPEPQPADSAHPRGTETLLVVEDEDNLRRLLSEVLEQHGYTVLATGQPKEAIAICSGHSGVIDLLLTDLVLPRMKGSELAQRAGWIRPDMRVLFMSGYVEESTVPGRSFLGKPFTPGTLTRKVREVLDAVHGGKAGVGARAE